MTEQLLHGATTDRVLAAFYRVYNELGWGFVESVYSKAMQIEFEEMQVPIDLERSVVVRYKDRAVGVFRADIIVENCVLVELKSAATIAEAHEKQVLNYLNATNIEVALLLNFGPRPSFKRYLLTNNRKKNVSV